MLSIDIEHDYYVRVTLLVGPEWDSRLGENVNAAIVAFGDMVNQGFIVDCNSILTCPDDNGTTAIWIKLLGAESHGEKVRGRIEHESGSITIEANPADVLVIEREIVTTERILACRTLKEGESCPLLK